MPAVFYTTTGEQIRTPNKPFSSGGEGSVYRVTTPGKKDFCLKIYHERLRTTDRERKLRYMVANPPAVLHNNNYTLCWPQEVVYKDANNRHFVGFLMSMANPESVELYELCIPDTNTDKLDPLWEWKYSRKTKEGLIARLKLCVNIAISIHAIHMMRKYTLVDFKPNNILVTNDGRISVIDLDSVQIHTGSNTFLTNIITLDYVPPEGKRIKPGKDIILETWDRFALGIVFYQILFGLHPYSISPKDTSKGTTIADHISNEFFPFGIMRHHIEVVPVLHERFTRLPSKFQQLFIRCFVEGNRDPSYRPSAEEWGKNVFEELSQPYAKTEPAIPPNFPPKKKVVPAAPDPKSLSLPIAPPKKPKNWLQVAWAWLFGD